MFSDFLTDEIDEVEIEEIIQSLNELDESIEECCIEHGVQISMIDLPGESENYELVLETLQRVKEMAAEHGCLLIHEKATFDYRACFIISPIAT